MKNSIRCMWLLMLALTLCCAAWGQTPDAQKDGVVFGAIAAHSNASPVIPADQQATREQVVAMLDATGGKKMGDQMMNMMMGSVWDMTVKKYQEAHPNATPEQLAKLKDVIDIPFPITMQDIIDAMVPIYQKHFTREEVAALTAFYNTPAGKSYLEKTPALMQDLMPMLMNLVSDKRMEEWGKKLAARMVAFDKEYPDKSAVKKPVHRSAAKQ